MMNSNKIVFMGSSSSPHNKKWIERLKVDYDITLITFDKEELAGVINYRIPKLLKSKADYLLRSPKVLRVIKNISPVLIHAQRIPSYGLLAAVYKRLSGNGTLMLSVWGEDIYTFPRKSIIHRLIVRFVLRQADYILSTSRVMKNEIEKYHHPQRDILITPFGIDLEQFSPQRFKKAEKSSIVIGTVKSLEKQYGVEHLLRAFAKLQLEYRETELHIVGDGCERRHLEILAEELKISDSVKFFGKVPPHDVPKYLRNMDIFAALSTRESFGVAILEASAMSLPVVASNIGGIPEVVVDGVTGFLVKPKDITDPYEKIVELIEDEKLRRSMGINGRKFVKKKYDWNENAKIVTKLYDRLVTSP